MPRLSVAGSNTPEGVNIDLRRDMEAFDLLPASMREQLQAAPFNYCAEDVLRAWVNSGLTDRQFIAIVMVPKFHDDIRNAPRG